MKNALTRSFDFNVDQASPVLPDEMRVVRHDDDGKELVTWDPVDYKSVQESLGVVDVWSLEAMLKAGINPDMPISTGYVNRIDGFDDLQQIAAQIDSVIESKNE